MSVRICRCRALVPFVVLVGIAAAEDKPAAFPTNEQIRHIRSMGDPRLSPDGKQVLLRVVDATADGAKGHLWLVPTDGSASRQLTYSANADKSGERSGQWMPDGQSILFLAHRGEHTALYRLPMNGGEAKAFDLKTAPLVDESKLAGALPPLSPEAPKGKEDKPEEVAIDVANFRVSPDGKTIALIAADPETPGEKKQKDAKADAAWVDHEIHGDRLYLLDSATSKLTVAGVPLDVRGAEWSADSSKLIVVREEPNGASELGPAMSAWVVSTADLVRPTKLEDLPPTIEAAAWSTDGSSIVYLAGATHEAPPGYADLYTYTLATKVTRNLTDGFDGSVGRMEPLPLKDGSVVEIAEKGLTTAALKFALLDGHTTAVPSSTATVSGLVTNLAQNGFAFLGSSGGTPNHLFYLASLDAAPKLLATPALIPDGIKSTPAKRLSWKSDGFTIDGMLYLPPEAATRKVPLIVEVHGGPLGAYVDSYTVFVDYLLGKGWAVLEANPRGSTGRGAAFAAANRNDLGGGDYRDIMAGVDFVLKTEPIDPAKLALTGCSYGGEMAGFVETKTDRFKAIVSMAPVIDQNSEYGTEKGSWNDQWYFGKPWEHEADAWRQSPLSGVARAKTPILLIQGESDTTDPLGQSQEMYRAMRQMKVPVELVTYPRVDHGPLGGAIYGSPTNEPWHGFDARRRIVNFIAKSFGDTPPEK